MASAVKKNCRRYCVEYLAHGFIPSPQKSKMTCLICVTTISNESMWPCKLRKHVGTAQKDNKYKPSDYLKK
jgi:hypothetical protein